MSKKKRKDLRRERLLRDNLNEKIKKLSKIDSDFNCVSVEGKQYFLFDHTEIRELLDTLGPTRASVFVEYALKRANLLEEWKQLFESTRNTGIKSTQDSYKSEDYCDIKKFVFAE